MVLGHKTAHIMLITSRIYDILIFTGDSPFNRRHFGLDEWRWRKTLMDPVGEISDALPDALVPTKSRNDESLGNQDLDSSASMSVADHLSPPLDTRDTSNSSPSSNSVVKTHASHEEYQNQHSAHTNSEFNRDVTFLN